MTIYFAKLIFILLLGIVSGFLNVVAAGGSLLTLPILIFMGLPSATANGTNRIALIVQNFTAVFEFKRKGYFNLRLGIFLGIPAIIGAIFGSYLAVNLPDEIFNKILALVMLLVLITVIKKPAEIEEIDSKDWSMSRKVIAFLVFLAIGFYGGFMQAGIGFIIISALLLLTGMNLVEVNSLKAFIIGIYSIFALAIFMFNGNIDWMIGIVLAIGNLFGAIIGTNFAISKGDKWIQRIIIFVILLMSAKLLFTF